MKKRAFLSDIHANIEALDAVLEDIETDKEIDEIVFLGDIIGYGPNPREVIYRVKKLRDRGLVVHFLPGNHEETFGKKMEGKRSGQTTKNVRLGMGRPGSEALEWMIEQFFTKDPRSFIFDDDYETKVLIQGRIEDPSGFIEEMCAEQDKWTEPLKVGLGKRMTSRWAKEWHNKLFGDFMRSKGESLMLRYQLQTNPELANRIAEYRQAKEIYDFLELVAGSNAHLIVGEVHCFHTPKWNEDKKSRYLLDDRQVEMMRHTEEKVEGVQIVPDHYDTPKQALEVAQRLSRKGPLCIAKGHSHVPRISLESDYNGVEVVIVDAGTVGMPRIVEFEGRTYYDKASYVKMFLEESRPPTPGDFEIVYVPYDWEKTHKKMKMLGLPPNKIWMHVEAERNVD